MSFRRPAGLVAFTTFLLVTAIACSGGTKNDGPTLPSGASNAGPDAAPIGKDCKVSPGAADVAYAQGSSFFCIAWRDTQSEEQSYRVALKYLPGGEEFVYPVAANAIEFFVPQSDWPEDVRLVPGACICEVGRKDFQLTVHAIHPSGEVLVGRLDIQRGEAH